MEVLPQKSIDNSIAILTTLMTCDALNKFMALLATWPEDSGQQ